MERFAFDLDRMGETVRALVPLTEGGGIDVSDAEVHVRYGDPALFEARIPRAQIRSARRREGRAPRSRGVHGGFGAWLVNGSGANLVELRLAPPVRASLRLSLIEPPTDAPRFGRALVKRFLRDRTKRVRRLTLSVAEPEAFLAAIGAAERSSEGPTR